MTSTPAGPQALQPVAAEFDRQLQTINSMLHDEGQTTRRKLAEVHLFFERVGLEWQRRAEESRDPVTQIKRSELALKFLKASAQAAAAVESLKRQRLPSQPAYQPRHAEWLT